MSSIAANVFYKALGRYLVCLLGACTSLVFAHHSPAAYDQTTESVIEGEITEISWRNPHVYLTLATPDADGKMVSQEIEAVGASNFVALGVAPDTLSVGDKVSVRVHPNRRGPGYEALGLALTRADGQVLALRSGVIAEPPAVAQASGLAGIWSPEAKPFFALALASQTWPFTEAGRTALGDITTRGKAAADCAPFGLPVMMIFPGLIAIEIADDRVTLDMDNLSTSRVIHLDIATPPDDVQPSVQGYSIGHWEGDTLVVDTTAFAEDVEGLGFSLPSSADKHVVERFKLSDDRRSLNYEAALTDPQYLTEPLRVSTTWSYRPDLKPSGQECDLESALRFQATP